MPLAHCLITKCPEPSSRRLKSFTWGSDIADTVERKKRSWIMSQVKSRRNKSTEEALVVVFRREKITGWRRNYDLVGKPDFVFRKERVAIFVDGCFWHGHPTRCRIPATNREYWISKINRNRARDRKVNRMLRQRGWQVIRIWEHLVNKPRTVSRLFKALKRNED